MIYESFITNKDLIYNKELDRIDETFIVDENYQIIKEDAEETVMLAGAIAYTAALVIALVSVGIPALKDKKRINKALQNYANHNDDLIPVSRMKYKVFKLDKQLSGSKNSDVKVKGDEDTGNIINRIFGTKIKDTRANRIVEYFYQGKPVMSVAYTMDGLSDTKVLISFADKKFAKHKDYYDVKLCLDRKITSSNAESFVHKWDNDDFTERSNARDRDTYRYY